jgi:hypothetical protein
MPFFCAFLTNGDLLNGGGGLSLVAYGQLVATLGSTSIQDFSAIL